MSRYHKHRIRNLPQKPKLVDKLTLIVAVLEPIITLPQVYIIFRDKSAMGVSLSTWTGYEILTIIWLWYGFEHDDKMIILYQGLFMVVQTGVIIGGLLYGARW